MDPYEEALLDVDAFVVALSKAQMEVRTKSPLRLLPSTPYRPLTAYPPL